MSLYYKKLWLNSLLSTGLVSYVDKCHDPEGVVHNGLLYLCLMGQVALIDVVPCDGTVSQHAPEVMHDLSAILCVVPTACLWEEGICNQWAHQGSEPDEEMKSLQKKKEKHAKRTETWLSVLFYWLRTQVLGKWLENTELFVPRLKCEWYHVSESDCVCFHLQENSRVPLIDGDQLDVGNGVDDTHGQSGHSHGDGQHQDIMAQRDDGKDDRDDERRDEQGRERAEQPLRKEERHTHTHRMKTDHLSGRREAMTFQTRIVLTSSWRRRRWSCQSTGRTAGKRKPMWSHWEWSWFDISGLKW